MIIIIEFDFLILDYVNCFETCECFALAFGIPAILMIISIGIIIAIIKTMLMKLTLVIFVAGTPVYIIKKTQKKSSMLYFDIPRSITVCCITTNFDEVKMII